MPLLQYIDENMQLKKVKGRNEKREEKRQTFFYLAGKLDSRVERVATDARSVKLEKTES